MGLSDAQRKQAHISGLSTDGASKYLYIPNATVNVPMESKLPKLASSFLTVTNTAYWVYIGQTSRALRAQYIYFFVSVQAAGDQVQELALATSSAGPDRAAKTLSVVAVQTTAGDYEAAAGSFHNTTSFEYTVPGATHLWLGCRFAWTNTPTQPSINALGLDLNSGSILRTATPGVLAVGSYTGALVTQSATLTTVMSPDLVLVGS
jgi:hypothetical protein